MSVFALEYGGGVAEGLCDEVFVCGAGVYGGWRVRVWALGYEAVGAGFLWRTGSECEWARGFELGFG